MVIYVDIDNVVANIHSPTTVGGSNKNLEFIRGAKEALSYISTHPEINIFIVHEGRLEDNEKCQWIVQYFPNLGDKKVSVSDRLKLVGNYLIGDENKWSTFNGALLPFDYRTPIRSWDNVVKTIKANLKNSYKLRLIESFGDGVLLKNETNTIIKKIVVKHGVSQKQIFHDLGSKQSVTLFHTDSLESGFCCEVLSVEWDDGTIRTDFMLSSSDK